VAESCAEGLRQPASSSSSWPELNLHCGRSIGRNAPFHPIPPATLQTTARGIVRTRSDDDPEHRIRCDVRQMRGGYEIADPRWRHTDAEGWSERSGAIAPLESGYPRSTDWSPASLPPTLIKLLVRRKRWRSHLPGSRATVNPRRSSPSTARKWRREGFRRLFLAYGKPRSRACVAGGRFVPSTSPAARTSELADHELRKVVAGYVFIVRRQP